MTISLHARRRKNIEAAPTDDGLEPLAEANLGLFAEIKMLTPKTLTGHQAPGQRHDSVGVKTAY